MLMKGNLVLNQTKSQETVGSNSAKDGRDSPRKKTVTFEDMSTYLNKSIKIEKTTEETNV